MPVNGRNIFGVSLSRQRIPVKRAAFLSSWFTEGKKLLPAYLVQCLLVTLSKNLYLM